MFISNNTVVDLSVKLNGLGNNYKGRVSKLLERFDFESTSDRTKCKHYPADMECKDNPEEIVTALELMSDALWSTLYFNLHTAYVENGLVLTDAKKFGERSSLNKVKIGKVWVTPPCRFSTVGLVLTEVQPFAYSYSKDGKTEIMGEINFGIEIY